MRRKLETSQDSDEGLFPDSPKALFSDSPRPILRFACPFWRFRRPKPLFLRPPAQFPTCETLNPHGVHEVPNAPYGELNLPHRYHAHYCQDIKSGTMPRPSSLSSTSPGAIILIPIIIPFISQFISPSSTSLQHGKRRR